jgi:ATP-binding cassette subfamily B protein
MIFYFVFLIAEPYIIPEIYGKITNLFIYSKGIQSPDFLNKLVYFFILYLASWFFSNVSWGLVGFLLSKLIPSLDAYMKTELYSQINAKDISFFIKNSEGGIVNNIEIFCKNTIEVTELLLKFIPGIIIIIFMIIKFALLNMHLGIMLILWLISHVGISFLSFNFLSRISEEQTQKTAELSNFFIDDFKNHNIKKFFNVKDFEFNKFVQLRDDIKKTYRNIVMTLEGLRFLKGILGVILNGFFINYVIFLMWKGGSITTENLIILTQMNGGIIHLAWKISEKLPNLVYSITKCESVMYLFNKEDFNNNKILEKNAIVKSPKGNIQIQNLFFKYENNIIFENINLDIAIGTKVAIVGKSGAGKSTFLNILAGIIENYEGAILFDNVNQKNIHKDFFNNYMTYVTYNGIISGTIQDNIKIGNILASDLDIIEACKSAKIYDFIDTLPEKLNTVITSSSNNILSEGQKRRIMIARALLRKNAKIVLGDEVFNGLDIQVKNDIIDIFYEEYYKKATIIMAAHDIEICKKSNIIIMVEEDQVTIDNYENIIKNENFIKLFNLV